MSRGAPSKYRPDIVAKICEALSVGATHKLACMYAGIDESTFTAWINRYPAFVDATRGAEGRAGIKYLAIIDKAAQNDNWQAAAWKLERRYPDQYGRTVQTQEHTGSVEVTHGAGAELLSRLAGLAARIRTDPAGPEPDPGGAAGPSD